MANTAYDHKLTEYQKKSLFNKLSRRSTFCISMGNHGLYNGAKSEHFEIDFLSRIMYQFGSKTY